MTQHTSRRFLLAGLAAAAPLAAIPLHAAEGSEPDGAFRTWLATTAAFNRSSAQPGATDLACDPVWDARMVAERAMVELPPTIMAAAATLLIELSYEFPTSADPAAEMDESNRAMTRVLTCLRPHLSGCIGAVAADLLDHLDRPFGASLLCRMSNGEVQS